MASARRSEARRIIFFLEHESEMAALPPLLLPPGPPGDGEGSGLLNGGGNTPCGGFREIELTSTGRTPKSGGSSSPLQEKLSRVVSSCLPSQRDNGYSRVGLTDD